MISVERAPMKNKKAGYSRLEWKTECVPTSDNPYYPMLCATTPSGVKITAAWGFTDFGEERTAIALYPCDAQHAYFYDEGTTLLGTSFGRKAIRAAEMAVYDNRPEYWLTPEEYAIDQAEMKAARDEQAWEIAMDNSYFYR